MRCFKPCLLAFFLIFPSLFAAEPFYGNLNEAQRFDLADAYEQVSDTFNKLGQAERADSYRKISEQIFPDSEAPITPPVRQIEKPTTEAAKKIEATYSENAQATSYYFEKLIRALNTENLSLALSIPASRLYIPGHERGLTRPVIAREVEKLFDSYNLQAVMPEEVFDMNGKTLERIPNNIWKLNVPVRIPYQKVLSPPFQGAMARFYFRKLPMGWKLIAMDTTS